MARIGLPPQPGDPLLAFTPVPHKAARRNSITAGRQRAFIAHLAATGIVTQAAMHIGASMEALYKLRNRPGADEFSAAWDAAVERGVQRLEDCALARAIDGVPEWKTDRDGGLITYGVKHNEALVMFFLRNRRPERYSEHIRPGHPVYERIRREVEAGLPAAAAEDREAACEGETDRRECALSRHFADRLAQVGPDGTAAVAQDAEAPAQLFLDKSGTKADFVRSRGRGANSRSRDSRQGETK
ncbi:hypothetical protein [Qipengyuania pacifica]|uniref:hypothetical protein n=1 Tax=Qipengyuania pacifica TaxID=2860199 RepID=UPI0035C7F981